MLLRPLENRVQPPVIRDPGEGALHHPADSGRDEDTIMTAGNGLNCESASKLGPWSGAAQTVDFSGKIELSEWPSIGADRRPLHEVNLQYKSMR
jgi:hypothetical protein